MTSMRMTMRKHTQRGVTSIMAASFLSLAIILLSTIDIGNVFWQQRKVQKVVDLAALAGSQKIGEGCAAAQNAAIVNAQLNGVTITAANAVCGNWNAQQSGTQGTAGGARLYGNPVNHFNATAPYNSVKVTASYPVPYLFFVSTDTRNVAAEATGVNDPIAGFSIGTGLVNLQGGLLNRLLGSLLGVSLNIASYQGLASASINLQDLSIAAGVGSVSQFLSSNISLNQLMLAMIQALGNQTAAVQTLNQLVGANVGSAAIGVASLLKVTTPTANAAASAQINALELLITAAQIANGRNAINLGTGISLGAVSSTNLKLVIVEPPSIAIGPAGTDSNGNWRTQAHSASVRLFIDSYVVDTSKLPIINGLVNIQLLHLPVYVEVAPGTAGLSNIQCATPKINSRTTINVQPGIASVCIADGMDTQITNTVSAPSCTQAATISSISVLGINSSVKSSTALSALVPRQNATPLIYNGQIGDADDIQSTGSGISLLSTAILGLTNQLSLSAFVTLPILGTINIGTGLLSNLSSSIISPLLQPTTGLIDSLVQPLLELLGIQLGYSTVQHQSLTCGNADLVY